MENRMKFMVIQPSSTKIWDSEWGILRGQRFSEEKDWSDPGGA